MHAFVNQNGLKCQEMVDKSVQLARKIRIPSKQASPDALPPLPVASATPQVAGYSRGTSRKRA
ncbi:hypothetical protein CE91St33_18050 [Eggerthella lenta]|nr:hypothetical protein CE91St33_18050 [Eggerthella lenta]